MIRHLALAIALLAPPALAAPIDDYMLMSQHRFGPPLAVPAGGVTLERETATWTLASGTIRLMEPLADGRVTGFVFEGSGTFRMTIPDPVELAQLRRFAKRPDLQQIEEPFARLVARSSADVTKRLGVAPPEGPYTSDDLADKRHQHWYVDHLTDADAHLVAATVNDAATYERIDVDTRSFGWLDWMLDSESYEEVTLTKFDSGYVEDWLSLDLASDRKPDGRPGPARRNPVELRNVIVDADLTSRGERGALGRTGEESVNARLEIRETLAALRPGVRALAMEISPLAREITATDWNGQPLTIVRDHLGKRSAQLDNDLRDPHLTLLLNEPLPAQGDVRISFRYELELMTYAPGDSWYPTVPDLLGDTYTAMMEFVTPKRVELRSMGKKESVRQEDRNEITRWRVDTPVSMLTFASGARFDEEEVKSEGAPDVISFGPHGGAFSGNMVRNVGVDVANALHFFGWLHDDPIGKGEFFVTGIPAGHGQAFERFLHVSELTFDHESPGASELFRAHETAHQWWGHRVGWASYRDQWISESFAEYVAMMFVESTVKGGDKYFQEILAVYDSMLKGSIQGGMSKFNRPWLVEINPAYRDRIGPVSLGRRAGTRQVPFGYQLQAYYRGPMVIHMLRMMLRNASGGSDDKFIQFLREVQKRHKGGTASAADLEHALETVAPGSWGWFFDQWVDRSEIPELRWSYTLAPGEEGRQRLTLNVKRVSGDGFILPVPVRVELADGRTAAFTVVVKNANETFERDLPSRPKGVMLNPDYAVLAVVKKE